MNGERSLAPAISSDAEWRAIPDTWPFMICSAVMRGGSSPSHTARVRAHPSDKKMFEKTVRDLRAAGVAFTAADVERTLLALGWAPSDARTAAARSERC